MNHQKRFDTLPTKPSQTDLLNYPEFLLPLKQVDNNKSKGNFIKRVIHKNYTKNREMISGFEGP